MAKKISQLTQATEVKSDDVTVIVQDGETKKLPLNMMVTKQDIENKKIAGLAKLDEIEATYENDTYTPTITVKNKSSVKVGEGDGVDYSANVMDGHVKSAILKGQTLVNLTKNSDVNFKLTIIHNWLENPTTQATNRCSLKITSIEPNTKYIVKILSETTQFYVRFFNSSSLSNGNTGWLNSNTTFTTLSDTTRIYITFRISENDEDYSNISQCSNIIILKYQEGMENWDIPYFEGMQSVKMPVLKTYGKNLCDNSKNKPIEIDYITGAEYANSNNVIVSDYIEINPLKTYIASKVTSLELGSITFRYYNNKKEYIGTSKTNEAKYVRIRQTNQNGKLNLNDILFQFEEGSIATSYEPYKSNILTVNEEVELRGIGDVKDELNLLTGELTQRIGEITFDGSEAWLIDLQRETYIRYKINLPHKTKNQSFTISDKLQTITNDNAITDSVRTANNSNTLWIYKINSTGLDEFKTWLSQNPITVQYQLETESIKTVDLMPSGTHPSTTPYCWKNGHIQLSSSGLLPNLEYSVVTSRAGQINQNATMIVKNDKRIFDLEILLAGGLVNTTYQALTLQNQVETGLSKVSLSSETEPDYLLYHMIMKLIEEKAYKLDDLTEKVSVFYLYEKLSDEQFETIYSALYPFVEDEIVEEPVVEELPEVVEDEVIM